MNRIFVYTSDFSVDQIADYPKVLAEAQEFTTSFGFTMEKVNLEFSSAMREVIIKGIRVMRPPLKKTKLRSLNTFENPEQSAPEPSLPAATAASARGAEKSTDPVDIRRLRAELSAATTLIEKITREKESLEANASREISTLKSSAEKLVKDLENLKEEKQATAAIDHDKRIQQFEAALAKKESEGKDLRNEISRLSSQNEISAKAKLQLEDELATEKNSAAAKISKLKAEIDSINSLLTAEKNASAETSESLAFLENSWKESQHREEDLCRSIDIMKEQNDQLAAELAKLRQQEGREAALLLKIATLEQETEEARRNIQQLAGQTPVRTALDAELKSLVEAKNDVEAEYIRMANEAMEKEAEMLENLYSADAEILRLSRELEKFQKAAAAEKAALQTELMRMKSAGAATITESAPARSSENSSAAAPPPLKPAAAPVPIIESVLEEVSGEDDTPDEAIFVESEIMAGLLNEFGSFCIPSGQSATEFTIDPDISNIEYSEPGEVLAILFSSNSVQAVPDGTGVKRCKGYVVALKKSGAYSVYLVWLLTESGKVVICTPEQQPADAAECTQIIQDAVSYFEIVGFMMEVEDLGGTVKSYNRAIKRVPALKRK
jgi:hypothetical protein